MLELHVDDPTRLDDALSALDGALEVGTEAPEPRPLVIDIIRP